MPRGEQQTTESADAARGEGLVRPRGESLEEREESREHLRDGHHRGVKMRGEVDDELQAVLARLVEPRVRLGLVPVRRGRVALGACFSPARTWSKMGRRMESYTRAQNPGLKFSP